MKNKKLAYALGYGVFLLLSFLVYSNLDGIVGNLVHTQVNDLKKCSFEDFAPKDEVYVALDPIRINENDFETISFSGRSSVIAEGYNENKRVTILFKSENRCYASEREPTFGGPVPPATASFNHNFSREISTLPLPEDTYDLYLYDWENEENYGLYDLETRIRKKDGAVMIVERRVEMTPPQDISQNANHCLDYVRDSGDFLEIEGWVLSPEIETKGQTVYLEITSGEELFYVECKTVSRSGVSNAFGNEKYGESGFYTILQKDSVTGNEFKLRIMMENDSGFYVVPQVYRYNIESQEVSSAEAEILEDSEPIKTGTQLFVEPVFSLEATAPCGPRYMDYIVEEDGNIVIEGWITAEDQETLGQQVMLEIEDEAGKHYISCDLVERNGVAEVLGNPKYANSGYIAYIQRDKLRGDTFVMKVSMQNANGVYLDSSSYIYNFTTKEVTRNN